MLTPEIENTMAAAGIVAVVTIDDPAGAVPLARSLLAGGIKVIELTFRTGAAAESIRRIRGEVPEAVVGAGTLLQRRQVEEAIAAGALFGVAPGCNPATIQVARELGLPFGPGVMTPSDIEIALSHDCRVLKFFPAQTSGGLPHLKTMAAPFAHLKVKFIPLGGISLGTCGEYAASPLVLAVGGSWVASAELIRGGQWDAITANAQAAVGAVKAARSK